MHRSFGVDFSHKRLTPSTMYKSVVRYLAKEVGAPTDAQNYQVGEINSLVFADNNLNDVCPLALFTNLMSLAPAAHAQTSTSRRTSSPPSPPT